MSDETEKIMFEAEKRARPKETTQTNRVADFPRATGDQRVVAHNGLSDEERATAIELGYDLRDVRFITGRLGAELTMLGVRQRTVVLDAYQLRAVLAELAQYAKADSGIGGGEGSVQGVGGDVSSYFAGLGSTATDAPATKLVQKAVAAIADASERTTPPPGDPAPAPPKTVVALNKHGLPKKKGGRPVGSKDKTKRAKRGSLVSKTVQDALEGAITSLRQV